MSLVDQLDTNVFAAVGASEKAYKDPTVTTISEQQLTAYTISGTMAVLSSMYWLQKFYMNHWMMNVLDFASFSESGINPNVYTYWSLADTMNVLITCFTQTVAALTWLLAPYHPGFLWVFVFWQTCSHYIQGVQWVLVAVFRFIAFFGDHPRSYEDGYSGFQTSASTTNLKISKEHRLQWWDLIFEWFGTLVGFGYYMDLVTIIAPQGDARDELLKPTASADAVAEGEDGAATFAI